MAGKVYITGDKHGSFLPIEGIVHNNEITEDDVLIIAGDAGYVWDENYPYRVKTLAHTFPGTVAFIDGNHENFTILNGLEVVKWCGGKAHLVGERVYHLMRGEVYNINGHKIFTFGGAVSSDRDRRVLGESWWEEEVPTLEEIEYGRKKLMENLDKIEYVITHESPASLRPLFKRWKPIDPDYHLPVVLDNWFELLSGAKKFKKWYCGHMHEDKLLKPQMRVIHNNITLLGDENLVKWA